MKASGKSQATARTQAAHAHPHHTVSSGTRRGAALPMAKAEVKSALRRLGLRATTARAAVYGCLLEAGRPLTHSDVCESLEADGLDRATVYRNLADLTDAKILRRIDHGDHLWRFEIAGDDEHADGTHHPHFVCTDCGTIECLPERTVELMKAALPGKGRKKDLEIQIRGQCDTCED